MTVQLYNEGKYGTGKYGGLGTLPQTYDECLTLILNEQYISTKLKYIALLPIIRGNSNPSYKLGLEVIAQMDNPQVKSLLTDEIYTFVTAATGTEVEPFNYVENGYIAANPGIVGNSFKSYVGVYYNDLGENTGEALPDGTGFFVIWDDNYIWNDEDIWAEV